MLSSPFMLHADDFFITVFRSETSPELQTTRSSFLLASLTGCPIDTQNSTCLNTHHLLHHTSFASTILRSASVSPLLCILESSLFLQILLSKYFLALLQSLSQLTINRFLLASFKSIFHRVTQVNYFKSKYDQSIFQKGLYCLQN